MDFKISNLTKIKLLLQRSISWINFLFIYYLYWIILFIFRKHKVYHLKEIRKQFHKICSNNKEPLLICPNHLTYIDSIILVMIFGSYVDYILDFRTMPWNFPKTTNVRRNFLFRILGYLGKCIFIELEHRKKNQENPIELAKYLLSKGEYVMLFPEGHRSTDGKVNTENFGYGVGKIIKEFPNIKILCIYLRGNTQVAASKYPNKYDKFYCSLKLLDPKDLINDPNKVEIDRSKEDKIKNSELRKTRQIAKNIVEQIAELEKQFFQSDYFYKNNSKLFS